MVSVKLKKQLTRFKDYFVNVSIRKLCGWVIVICGLLFIVLGILYVPSVIKFLSLLLGMLWVILGSGVVILSLVEERGENIDSVNGFIGQKLFETSLNGLIIGVFITIFTAFFS